MFDLVSVVGHVNDTTLDGSDDNNDNLIAHIRVGSSYHLKKEVVHFVIIRVIFDHDVVLSPLKSNTKAFNSS